MSRYGESMLRSVKRLLGQVYEEVRYFEMPGRLEVGRRMEMLERFKEFCERIGGVLRREKEFVATCVLPRRMHVRVTALKSFDGRVRGEIVAEGESFSFDFDELAISGYGEDVTFSTFLANHSDTMMALDSDRIKLEVTEQGARLVLE